jgi:sugar lactone lactonase YvrE
MRIERVATVRCRGGENPLWDAAGQALYFVDNFGKQVHRYSPASGQTDSWEMPEIITTLALRAEGGAVVTFPTGIFLLDFATGALAPLHLSPSPPDFVFNDGRTDRRGRFLIGACTTHFDIPQNDGGLYRLDPDHTLTKVDGDIHFSNGNCFSPDQSTFYFSDSWRHIAYQYDYDIETGTVANRRPFIDTTAFGGQPDGATVDSQGIYWAALYTGGKVAAFRPNGKLERVIDMPVKLVSSVMFGGPGLDVLYVTTMQEGPFSGPPEAGAGYLYAIEGLGTTGLPEPRYAG